MNKTLKQIIIIVGSIILFEITLKFFKGNNKEFNVNLSYNNFFPHVLNDSTKYLLIGQWHHCKLDLINQNYEISDIFIEFKEDGNCIFSKINKPMQLQTQGNEVEIKSTTLKKGKWVINKERICFTFSDSTFFDYYKFITPDEIAVKPLNSKGLLLYPSENYLKLERINHTQILH